jgi:elongation factor Ts
MPEITAASVKAFREKTGLPMMDCKQALTEAGGDEAAAIEILRKKGAKLGATRSDRETAFGRFGIFAGLDKPCGAIVELKCESAPVTQNEEFIQLANDLAEACATHNPASVDALLALKSPSKPTMTVGEQRDELFNRIREKFEVGRFVRFEGTCGGYSHNRSCEGRCDARCSHASGSSFAC